MNIGKTIKSKLDGIMVGFILMMVVMLGVFAYTYKSLDATMVDLAGRQRMLLQKFSKEFLFTEVFPSQIEHFSLRTAEYISTQVLEHRTRLTGNLSEPLPRQYMSHAPQGEVDSATLPLPATFARKGAERDGTKGKPSYKLVGKWNINRDKGLLTDFEKEAFEALMRRDRTGPFFKFIKENNGFTLKYAAADRAGSGSCADCHNTHPGSPRRDFKEDDLMGMVVVTVPVAQHISPADLYVPKALNAPRKKPYEETAMVFERTLEGLMNGGEVPVDLAMTEFRSIPPAVNGGVLRQLSRVEGLWKVLLEKAAVLASAEVNSTEYLDAVVAFEDTSNEALQAMNAAVALMSEASNARLFNLVILMFALISGAICFGAFGWHRINKLAIDPVKKILVMTSALSRGDFTSEPLSISGGKEMVTLGNALNKMKSNLSEDFNKARIINNLLKKSMEDDSLDDILYYILEQIVSVPWLDIESTGGIWLVEAPGVLALKAQKGLPPEIQNGCGKIVFGQCVCGRVAVSGEAEFCASLNKKHGEASHGIMPQGHYCVPIKYSGDLLGVLNMYFKDGHGQDDREVEFLTSIADITANIVRRKHAESALKESEERFHKISSSAKDSIIVFDPDGGISYWNHASERIFGYKNDYVQGKDPRTFLFASPDIGLFEKTLHNLKTGRPLDDNGNVVEIHGLGSDGREIPLEVSFSTLFIEGRPNLLAILRDITERKNAEESIRHMAYHDHLTGLPNRSLFRDRLEQVVLRESWHKRTAAVLFLDLDRFKVINDTLGHAFGDNLLKVVAERLRKCLRDGDTVARFGGDEFTVLLQYIAKPDDILVVIEKIFNAINRPIRLHGEEITVKTSIGVAMFPVDGEDADTLIRKADIAMYRAKADSSSYFQMYTQDMSTRAVGLLKMEQRLARALERNEFILHYQPEVDLRTERLVGMEALMRLVNPDGTLVPPGEFIPVAEETGIIVSLSEWVLWTSCEQNRRWQLGGLPPLTVAVNISPRVFGRRDFVRTVTAVLKETGLKPEYLEIEITEDTLMGKTGETIDKMKALKGLGVRFAIDDFGTGYSSLSYLKELPIEMLKIDRAFVRDLSTGHNDMTIVRAIINMAHSMGLEVLAEGVESEDQLSLLRSIGCDKAQGYLLGKPVNSGEFEGLLKEASTPPEAPSTRCGNS